MTSAATTRLGHGMVASRARPERSARLWPSWLITSKRIVGHSRRLHDSGRERVFFFQAEDGIRDYKVTGVQTCALPILALDGVGGEGVFGASTSAGGKGVYGSNDTTTGTGVGVFGYCTSSNGYGVYSQGDRKSVV